MKYFITIALTIAIIKLTNCLDLDDSSEINYGDDAGLFSYDEVEDRIDDSPKPTYNIKDAPTLFEEFKKQYAKTYKDVNDEKKHLKNFIENLKEINRINSDKEYSSTSDINLFTDLSAAERAQLLG